MAAPLLDVHFYVVHRRLDSCDHADRGCVRDAVLSVKRDCVRARDVASVYA